MNRRFEEIRRQRVRGRVLAVLLFVAFVLFAALEISAPAKTAPPPLVPCVPVALAVVAGDSAAADVAYVLDACGHVRRQVAR